MALYKYVTAERIDVLEHELIRFTQPSALNDPCDLKPHVERLFTDGDLERLTSPFTNKSDDELLDYMSRIIERGARERSLGNKSRHEIKEAMVGEGKELLAQLRELYDHTFAKTFDNMKEVLGEVVADVPVAVDRSVGILSLTEKPEHPLMWSHYSGNHTGIVLMFDETHEFFKSPRKALDEIRGLRQVKYSAERPSFDPLIDMSLLDEDENSDIWASWIDKMFFTKSPEWAYEQEWRMLRPLKDATKVLQSPAGNIHLFSLPSSCLEGVILGQRTNGETRARIAEFLSSERFKHTKLFEAKSSSRDFKIEISTIRTS